MPEIGEIRQGKDIGRARYSKWIWLPCVDCGSLRWTFYQKGRPVKERCFSCAVHTPEFRNKLSELNKGAKSNFWKGGRGISQGYIVITLDPDDFFYPMVDAKGRVLEHRLVMAKHLGRCLHPWEIVHHKNGIRSDNRLENLQLVQEMQHKQITLIERKLGRLTRRVEILEGENEALRKEIRLLRWKEGLKGGVEC